MQGSQDSNRSRFARRFAGTLAVSTAIALIGFATGVIAARLLGPDLRGQLAAIQLWALLAASLGLIGLPEALTFYSAREKRKAGSYTVTAVLIGATSTTVLAIVLWMLMPRLLGQQSTNVVDSARVFLWYVPIAPILLPLATLRGIDRFPMWNVLRLMPPALWLLVLVGFAWNGNPDPRAIAVTYVAILAPYSVLAASWTFSVVARPRRWSMMLARQLMRYGIPNAAADVPSAINLRVDQLVIAAMLPSDQLGLYVVAVAWSMATRPLSAAYGLTFMPHLAKEDDPSARAQAFATGMRVATTIVLTSGLLHLALTRVAIPIIFGKDFSAATGPAVLLAIAASIWSYGATLRDGVRGLGHPSAILWAELAGVPVSLTLLVLLIGPFGLAGAAFASICGYSASVAVLITISSRTIGLPVASIVIPRRSDIANVVRGLRSLVDGTR